MSNDSKERPFCPFEESSRSSDDSSTSLWTKVHQLQRESLLQVHAVYGEHFPIEVRHFLAAWLEEKNWTDIDPGNPQHEQHVASLVSSLILELEMKANSMTTEELSLTKIKLMEAANTFRERYLHNPQRLFEIIRHCLNTEKKLVQQAGLGQDVIMPCLPSTSDVNTEITQQLDYLRRQIEETGSDLRIIEQEQEALTLQYHKYTKVNAHLQHIQRLQRTPQTIEMQTELMKHRVTLEQLLNQKVESLMQLKLTFVDKLKDTIESHLMKMQSRVLDEELIRWKREQQLQGYRTHCIFKLDAIQKWCESLTEVIWISMLQIKEADRSGQMFDFDLPIVSERLLHLNAVITQLLSSLVTSTFIIEKQPPQVLKTNTRFTCTVRFLVGKKLNVHMNPPQVTVTIVNEAQVNALLKNDMSKGVVSGEILNNTGTMEYYEATQEFSVSFRNLVIKKVKRAEKVGTETVTDEKYSLLFQFQFSVGGEKFVFQVSTLSLPVIVIAHGIQERRALATVTWDSAFAEPGRIPFAVPDKVSWSKVSDALNMKFKAAAGRFLTDENLRYLAEKAFRNLQVADYSGMLLSFSQFCNEPLPDRWFTFWEWFFAAMKLTQEHLRDPWMDEKIVGFIRKNQAEEMLAGRPNGTFLLRFSDSELGGVTIAWVAEQNEVFMLQPFTSRDFVKRSLAERIYDLQHLVYLYPDIPKEQAFGKYYSPYTEHQQHSLNGYVKHRLVTQASGWSEPGSVGSHPATPQTQDPNIPRDTSSVASATSESVSSLHTVMDI